MKNIISLVVLATGVASIRPHGTANVQYLDQVKPEMMVDID